MHNEGYGTLFVCVCVFILFSQHALPIVQQGQRTIEKVLKLAISLKTLCFEIMAFLQLFIFFKLRYFVLCYHVFANYTVQWGMEKVSNFYKDVHFI